MNHDSSSSIHTFPTSWNWNSMSNRLQNQWLCNFTWLSREVIFNTLTLWFLHLPSSLQWKPFLIHPSHWKKTCTTQFQFQVRLGCYLGCLLSKVPKFMEPGSLDNPLILNLLFLDISVTNSLLGFRNSLFIRVEVTPPAEAFIALPSKEALCFMIVSEHTVTGQRRSYKVNMWRCEMGFSHYDEVPLFSILSAFNCMPPIMPDWWKSTAPPQHPW